MRNSVNRAKYLIGLVLGFLILVSCLILQAPPTRLALLDNISHEIIPTPCVPVSAATPPEPDPAAPARVLKAYGKLPMRFEANRGQTDGQVKFLSRGSGYTLFLTPNEAVLALKGGQGSEVGGRLETLTPDPRPLTPDRTVLRLRLVGANPAPQMRGLEELPGKSNYFIGDEASVSGGWYTDIANYAKVEYQNVYPGVNLVYYGNQQQLEYDFIVAPGADPSTITLDLQGADKLNIDARGDLILHRAGSEIRQHKPHIYQEINGAKQTVAGHYVLRGRHHVGFQLASYDTSRPLIIDPIMRYSTYFGGSGDDQGFGIATDGNGNAYVTGQTSSTDFPRPWQGAFAGGVDAFVAKLNPAGNTIVYLTYLGGSGFDSGRSIAVDATGNAYVTGVTDSTDFPTRGPIQAANRGGSDAFVVKLNPTGALAYSTYLGGRSDDAGFAIAVDGSGSAYVTGRTASDNFPTANPLRPALAGGVDAFVAKLNATGNLLVYSTYLGGGGDDIGFGIALDANGNAYVTGETASNDFPTARPYQANFAGVRDVFVTKLNATGNLLVYSTYLGSTGSERGNAIAVDAAGNAYVTGRTSSADFPADFPYGGNMDAFVTEFNADGSALVFSRYLGGSGMDEGRGIAVDAAGNVYVTGTTTSSNFPTTRPIQSWESATNRGGSDAFVTKLNALDLNFSTYFGGGGSDAGHAIAVDAVGNIYATGTTNSNNLTTKGAVQATNRGGPYDAFIVKIGQTVLGSLRLNPSTVIGAVNSTGTVELLNDPAEPGGAVVDLSSSDTNVALVPDTVTIPQGLREANFTVYTSPVATLTNVTISAQRNGVPRRARLTVVPASLKSLTLDPDTITGGSPTYGIITLDGLAPPNGAVVTLSSSNPTVATVPASVTVPEGGIDTLFTINTSAVSETTSVIIYAFYREVRRMATLRVVVQGGATKSGDKGR